MKTILACFLFLTFTASAQYRFNIYRFSGIATNATIATNAIAAINHPVDVGSGTEATIQLTFRTTPANLPAATNGLVSVWETSLDGTRYTNRFTFTVNGNGTTNEAWGTTKILTEVPWLRLVNITNTVGQTVTNYTVTVGNRVGL